MPSTMGHERERWRNMGEGQLRTRLGRIRKREKLSNFADLAYEHANLGLLRACADRATELGYGFVMRQCQSYLEMLDQEQEAAPAPAAESQVWVQPGGDIGPYLDEEWEETEIKVGGHKVAGTRQLKFKKPEEEVPKRVIKFGKKR